MLKYIVKIKKINDFVLLVFANHKKNKKSV